jgi:hypothetical protein
MGGHTQCSRYRYVVYISEQMTDNPLIEFMQDTMFFRSHTRYYRVCGVLLWIMAAAMIVSLLIDYL